MNCNSENPIKDIGMNYIHFAMAENSINDLINDNEVSPILEILAQELQSDIKDVRLLFKILSIYVHGYASFLANNSM